MALKVKFLREIIKAGKLRKPGDEMELPEGTAARLAEKGVVEIPGKKVIKAKEEVEVLKIVDKKPKAEK